MQRQVSGLCGEEGAWLLPADSSCGTEGAPRLSGSLPTPRTARPKALHEQLRAGGDGVRVSARALNMDPHESNKGPIYLLLL